MKDSIRVAHVSTYSYGGAAFAARRLHEGLLAEGTDSRFWYGPDPTNDSAGPTYAPLPIIPEDNSGWLGPVKLNLRRMKLKRARRDWREHLSERPEGYEVFSAARQFKESFFDIRDLKCDILNLHWVAFLCDYPSFFSSIPHRLPVVWTLHDMNPLTGGCHYAGDCRGFQSGCGNCPQVSNPQTDDVSRYAFQVKRRAMRSKQLHIVTPSRWLGELAQQSPIWPKRTEFSVIPYGLELDRYTPTPRAAARKRLGIATDAFVLAFGAEDIANHRKGMKHLIRAIRDLPASEGWVAVVFGGGDLPEGLPDWLEVKQVGYLTTPEEKSEVYSAADVFVMPSLEDNQPQTGLEAMACGTAVVAFDAGGIPEYVRHLETGLLAKEADTIDLGRQLLHASSQENLTEQLGEQAREMMEREFPLHLQAERYLDLYSRLRATQSDTYRRAA